MAIASGRYHTFAGMSNSRLDTGGGVPAIFSPHYVKLGFDWANEGREEKPTVCRHKPIYLILWTSRSPLVGKWLTKIEGEQVRSLRR